MAARKRPDAGLAALLAGPPAAARAALLAELEGDPPRARRRALEEALHGVADVAAGRWLLEKARPNLAPERLPLAVLVALYGDVAAEVPRTSPREVTSLVRALGALADPIPRAATGDEAAFVAATRALLRTLLAVPALRARLPVAAQVRRVLASADAEADLRAAWRAVRTQGAMARWVEWARLGAPEDDVGALLDEVLVERAPLAEPTLLAATVPQLPARSLRQLLAAYGGSTTFAAPVAARLVAETDALGALVGLLDDPALAAAFAPAARKIVAIDPAAGAEHLLARAGTLPAEVVAVGLEALAPGAAFERFRSPSAPVYAALVVAPRALRSGAWFDVLEELPARGRELLVAIARDRGHAERARAVGALADLARTARDRLEKRHVLFALGATGHPEATLPLVAALDDPDLGDTGPLVCTALGACGDTRALPILAERRRGRHASFVEGAIHDIKARTAEIHRAALAAAQTDPDPLLRDLATRAAAGDDEAAIVLEDALRESGRL